MNKLVGKFLLLCLLLSAQIASGFCDAHLNPGATLLAIFLRRSRRVALCTESIFTKELLSPVASFSPKIFRA
jgi:hypothetical protein